MVVVLLHPLGVDSSFWDPMLRLGGLGDVVAVDLPGHGSADALAGEASLGEHADDVWRRAGCADGTPVDLVGVSLGGLVAQQLAAERADMVRSVTLVDTVPTYSAEWRENWRARAATARTQGLDAIADATMRLWFTPEFSKANSTDVNAVKGTLLGTHPESYARACELLAEADVRPLLDRITAPTLVGCGIHDADPFVSAATAYGEVLDVRQVVWLQGAHAAARECATDLHRALIAFWASI